MIENGAHAYLLKDAEPKLIRKHYYKYLIKDIIIEKKCWIV